MIVEGLLLVLGYFLLHGPIIYIVAATKLMLGGILVSVIGFLKAAVGSFILLIVTAFMRKVYKETSESGSELEPTYSSADMKTDELSKNDYLIIIMFLAAVWYLPPFRRFVIYALIFLLVYGFLAKMNL